LVARVLLPDLADHEACFLALADHLLPAVGAGIVIAAVLSAIMSTVDSQLLVIAASLSHDLGLRRGSVGFLRLVVLVVSVLALGLALVVTDDIFSSVLFAWSALGAAFGPLLVVVVWRRRPAWTVSVAAMGLGFLAAVLAYSFPATKGGVVERVVPVVVAAAVALWGTRRPT
jgi:sodium/proline symporter